MRPVPGGDAPLAFRTELLVSDRYGDLLTLFDPVVLPEESVELTAVSLRVSSPLGRPAALPPNEGEDPEDVSTPDDGVDSLCDLGRRGVAFCAAQRSVEITSKQPQMRCWLDISHDLSEGCLCSRCVRDSTQAA